MKRVLKWTIPVDDQDHPIGSGPVVHVACMLGPGHVQVWTEEPQHGGDSPRRARVYGTGQPIDDGEQHIGSVVTAGGALVWHVYGSPR